MNEIHRTVLEWTARFIEDRDSSIGGVVRLVVPGERAWRFSTEPVRQVREESLADLDSTSVDCTITVAAADLVQWGRGELNPQAAFSSGRIRVAGDGLLALQMNRFFGPRR